MDAGTKMFKNAGSPVNVSKVKRIGVGAASCATGVSGASTFLFHRHLRGASSYKLFVYFHVLLGRDTGR